MKAKLLIFVCTYIFVQSISAQSFDFRNTNWGMDSLQVKKVENSSITKSKKNVLVYNCKIADYSAEVIYNFTLTNKLYEASYFMTFDQKNPQISVNAFLSFQEILNQKYGTPIKVKANTINGKVLTQEEWATNLISNNLNLETTWKNDKTKVTMSLFNLNDVLYIDINYSSLLINNVDERKAELKKNL